MKPVFKPWQHILKGNNSLVVCVDSEGELDTFYTQGTYSITNNNDNFNIHVRSKEIYNNLLTTAYGDEWLWAGYYNHDFDKFTITGLIVYSEGSMLRSFNASDIKHLIAKTDNLTVFTPPSILQLTKKWVVGKLDKIKRLTSGVR